MKEFKVEIKTHQNENWDADAIQDYIKAIEEIRNDWYYKAIEK